MTEENKLNSLEQFQKNCFKAYKTLGFSADNSNIVFEIIIQMRNLVVSAEAQDTILLHKHMGLCAEAIANYATVNSIKLKIAISKNSHQKMFLDTDSLDLEYYLEKIKNELAFVNDMEDSEKIGFIQKCWISVFPEEYHDDFLKVDRILKTVIEDNKIKFPQFYINQ